MHEVPLFLGASLSWPAVPVYKRLLGGHPRLTPGVVRPGTAGEQVYKFAQAFAAGDPWALHQNFISRKQPDELVLGCQEPPAVFAVVSWRPALSDLTARMLITDALAHLSDEILTKVDRASMGVDLEARIPILDHREVEFAGRLPVHLKIRNGQGKWLLRQVLCRYVAPANC